MKSSELVPVYRWDQIIRLERDSPRLGYVSRDKALWLVENGEAEMRSKGTAIQMCRSLLNHRGASCYPGVSVIEKFSQGHADAQAIVDGYRTGQEDFFENLLGNTFESLLVGAIAELNQ
jgi:hypothetical protein